MYQRRSATGEVFSTHTGRIDAVKAARATMNDGPHPCTLQWAGPQNVNNIYWNPLFETLEIRQDRLLGAWSIVPAQGTCHIGTARSRRAACKRGIPIQNEYDFKRLHAYDASGNTSEERDHRFLRHNITSSTVRFDPSGFD